MFRRVLVANRGEIALRVIYALKELGIESVVIYSEVDEASLPVQLADYAVCVGPAPAKKSYLNIPNIISAALISGADAVHPGYGFLAENPDFAEICERNGIRFIGPSPDTILKMGNKLEARRIMERIGVPIIPGTLHPISDIKSAIKWSEDIDFPVMLKAVAGGGGRGMRVVYNRKELETQFTLAQTEAQISFGDGRLYIEKYLEKPRHIEIQILGDKEGNIITFPERECSVQRRYQKILEESPSPGVDDTLREKIEDAARRGAEEIGYTSLGTMEFLLTENGEFFFIEMNTRVQVEHPVTESITGIDLIKEQMKVSAGERLSFRQSDVKIRGDSIEVRINAEDADRDFTPSPGNIEILHLPKGPGVRVDTHIYQGYTVPPHYDSLIAKLIVTERTRRECIKRLDRALEEFLIEGIKTNISFHRKIVNDSEFIEGKTHIHFLDKFIKK